MAEPLELLRIEVIRNGNVTALEIGDGAILVGTGSHCDVRLLPQEGAPEHLRIDFVGGRVSARVLAPTPACALDDRAFAGGAVPTGSQLRIGDVVLRCKTVVGSARRGKDSGGKGGLPPAVRVTALLLLAVGFYVVLSEPLPHDPLMSPPHAPPLFPNGEVACPAVGEGDATFEARRSVREAELRGERAPFHAQDGMGAVALYDTATACFAQVGAETEANEAARQAARLRAFFVDEFRVRRVRLERLLYRAKYVQAQREIAILQGFLYQRTDPYTEWLAAVQRELTMRFARAEKAK
ncbi:MAG: FHA domain-containing protein [Myxococcales bacterium]|nr:FHA domain-containing protein [Myxococcales bacterium]